MTSRSRTRCVRVLVSALVVLACIACVSGAPARRPPAMVQPLAPAAGQANAQGQPAAPANTPVKDSEEERHQRLDFMPGFVASVVMIVVSELGDKTFFIAAIMAMRHSRITVFVSALGALAVMTVLSALMGVTLPNLLPREYVHIASVVLFFIFGIRLLKEAYEMEPDEPNEELEEVEMELDKKELDMSTEDMETGAEQTRDEGLFSPVFMQCFTMTFLAEWGDRSQIATIALAAAKNAFGVTVGGVIGHALCTGLAVAGGKLLATSISERSVAFCGGVLFLVFAAHGYLVPDA